ncbi:MAG: hypothetical protein AAF399_11895 [Bacteroidota bacterium]
MREINALVESKQITAITFVLSDDNPVILDALGDRTKANTRGLSTFYAEITRHRSRFPLLWQSSKPDLSLLSYLLNSNIAELKLQLNTWQIDQIRIDAHVYHRHRNEFREVSGESFYRELICLN